MNITWYLFLLCLLMAISAWMIFWWTIRSGQFQDAEITAAEMLELDACDGTEVIGRTVAARSTSPAGEVRP